MNELHSLRAYAIRKGIDTATANRSNEVALWRLLARQYGVSPSANLNEVSAARKILEKNNIAAEGYSETVLLRKLAILEGDSVQGAENRNEAELLSFLSYPYESQPPPPAPDIQTLTNAQKLSLSPSTPVGTVVHVSDGFVVSGSGSTAINGVLYVAAVEAGHTFYRKAGTNNAFGGQDQFYDDSGWVIDSGGVALFTSTETGNNPWDVTTWTVSSGTLPAPTLTHPAVQTLAAPGRGALSVSGGTLDGTYLVYGTFQSKQSYCLSSVLNSRAIFWDADNSKWVFTSSDAYPDPIYYSLSDTPTPLTATGWKNASDDTPASITIALTDPKAGVFVSGGTQDGVWTNNGTVNSKESFLFLGAATTDDGLIRWMPSGAKGDAWEIRNDNGAGLIYYANNAVASPDLVTTILSVFTVDINALSLTSGNPATCYGHCASFDPANTFIICFDTTFTLAESIVDFTAVNAETFMDMGISDSPTKQQIIDKIVALSGGKVTDLGSLKISVAPTDRLLEPLNFTGMSGSGFTQVPKGWYDATNDSPASITVSSVSQGDIDAGNKLGSVVRSVNGATNGRNKFTDVLAVATDLTWDGTKWTDGATNGSTNTATPDIGTSDPVASEANWVMQ